MRGKQKNTHLICNWINDVNYNSPKSITYEGYVIDSKDQFRKFVN